MEGSRQWGSFYAAELATAAGGLQCSNGLLHLQSGQNLRASIFASTLATVNKQ
jgi:hypothetical protein